jgi:CRP/FNR family cyclic AMP-dependent transcriptional regulator
MDVKWLSHSQGRELSRNEVMPPWRLGMDSVNRHSGKAVIVGMEFSGGECVMKNALYMLLDHPSFEEGVVWTRRKYAADETVFSEGDHGSQVYLILKGSVRVVGNVDLDDNRTVHPGFSELDAGQVFGELPIFDGEPRSATVVALTDCDLAVLEGEQLMAFLDAHPELGYPIFKELIHLLVGRLRQANRRIFSLFAWGLKLRGIDRHL